MLGGVVLALVRALVLVAALVGRGDSGGGGGRG